MGKKLNDRIEKASRSLINDMQNFIFMKRLQQSNNTDLITQFEHKGFPTTHAKATRQNYSQYYPELEDMIIILSMLN